MNDIVFSIDVNDIQEQANMFLNRDLSETELAQVLPTLLSGIEDHLPMIYSECFDGME